MRTSTIIKASPVVKLSPPLLIILIFVVASQFLVLKLSVNYQKNVGVEGTNTSLNQTQNIFHQKSLDIEETTEEKPKTPFDIIVKIASDEALAPVYILKKQFDPRTWHRLEGGLNEIDRRLLADIYTNATSLFEYGLGESTLLAAHVGVPRYSGIDTDAVWISKARDRAPGHFRFYLADIGKIRDFGNPVTPTLSKNVLNSQLAPLIVEPLPFDVYMVDGRYRVACLLASFLHSSARGGEDPTVLLHDCGRTWLQSAEKHFNVTRTAGANICVYKRKESTTDEELMEEWEKQKKDFQ